LYNDPIKITLSFVIEHSYLSQYGARLYESRPSIGRLCFALEEAALIILQKQSQKTHLAFVIVKKPAGLSLLQRRNCRYRL
jgi:hypothetical protein